MATGTSSVHPGAGSGSSRTLVEYDQFIDKQLRRTRTQVRVVDIASGLLLLATGTLAYFLVLALLDHWAVTGGLPGWARLTALVIYLGAAGAYFFLQILPLVIRKINPLYAAETIERTQPSLKNSLLNFLMLRAHPQGLSQSVYHAVEQQAATNLAHVPIETVVDRSKLIKIGYALAGVLAVCALYKVLSPKDPITSFGRFVMPWADILPPTRVQFVDIKPGNTKAFRGQQIAISAEVRGLERDGAVTLVYSTADGQTVDRVVELKLPQDGYRHTCTLPPDEGGLQQTIRYRLLAGDARSREYEISVVAAPTIVVDSVEYLYPDYTGLSSQKIEHAGDVKAIEGTRIILHAVTNQPIRDAGLDFECDEREELTLAIDGTGDLARGATGSFALALDDDRLTPLHTIYQLRFRNVDGNQNLEPIRHTIEVVPDISPEIEFLAPKTDEVRVREGDELPIEITASDPDFALERVRLIAEVGDRRVLERSLLKSAWRGQFNHKYRLNTNKLGLKAGDIVEYWAVADDIKSPQPNETITQKRRIQIVPKDAQGEQGAGGDAQDQPPMAGEPEEPPKKDQPGEEGEQPQDPADAQDQKGGDQGDPSQQGKDPQQGDDPQEGENGESKAGESEKEGDQGEGKPKDSGDEGEGQQDKSGDQGSEKQGPGESGGDSGEPKNSDQQQPGGKDGQQGDAPPQPVANDGTQDGDAMEKILKHQQQNGNKNESQQQPPEDGQSKNEEAGSQKSKQENKQTGGQNGGQEKPNNKQPNPDNTQDDSGESSGEESKGVEEPSQSPNANAKQKKGEQGGQNGAEQKGDLNKEAKQGENSQQGEATDQVGKDAKEEWGEAGKDGQSQKASDQDKQQGDGQSGKKGSNSGNKRDQQPGKESGETGSGEHAKGDDQGGEKKPDGAKPRDDAKGGSDEQEKGESGAGRPGGDNQGSPESQGEGKQKDKHKKKSAGEQDEESKQEAQSPSNSNKESDSNEGESDGDKSGAGKQGGGQKANQPGAGGAGKNTAADEGAGQSDEQGEGLESGKAGSQKQADEKTGKSGTETGQGSQSRAGDEQSQGKKGEQSGDNQNSSEGKPTEQQNNQQGGPGDGTSRGQAKGGGHNGEQTGTPDMQQGNEPGGDAANLDYARKATDLALEHLRDQLEKGEPDQELLDELGWTKDDVEKFLQRWQAMKAASKTDAPQAEEKQRELDATLRSLGLRPRGTTLSGNRTAKDTQRNLKESRRTSPPPDYAEQYKAYTQGTARGGK